MRTSATAGVRALALASAAVIGLAGGMAWAQGKPAPQGAPQATLPTAKPPPLGAPGQAQPAPRTPAAPPVAQAPQRPTAVVPANEPAAITRLRQILNPRSVLTYATAQALDAAGEQVRMTGVVLEEGDNRFTADEITIAGLRPDGVAEAVITGFMTRADGTEVRIGRVRMAGIVVPPMNGDSPVEPDKIRIEALTVQDVAMTGDLGMRLASASIENWIAGQPVRFALEGLELSGLDGGLVDGLRLARFAFNGIDIGGTIAAIMRLEAPSSLVGTSAMELDRLELTGGGQPVGSLAEMRLTGNVTSALGSGTGTMALRGIRIEPIPIIAAWLTRFGYQAIEGDITADSAYDATTGRIELRDLSIAMRDVGTVSFSMTLDGLTPERANAQDFESMLLVSMGVRYADASLFRRFLAMQSAQTRTPEAQLREQFAAMLGGALSQPGEAALDPIRTAVQRFIRGEAQTLEIRAKPPQPVTIQQVQGRPPASPADAQRIFGITAEAR